MVPKKIYVLTKDLDVLNGSSILTKAWVGINSYQCRTEYTDLSQVWHDAKEEPEKGKLLIGIDEDDVSIYNWVDQDKDWLSLAEWFSLIRWAYLEDLLPKDGNEKDIK